MAHRQGRSDRRVPDPAHHLRRRLLHRRRSPTPTSCCRTRPTSNATTASSLLDRPISDADGAADAIRHPVVRTTAMAGRDVRAFQDVLLDLGARLGLPGMVDDDGAREVSRDYAQLHRRATNARPASACSPAGAASDGDAAGVGAPNPDQLAALHRARLLLARGDPASRRATTRWRTATTSTGRSRSASSARPSRSCCSCIRRRCRSSVSPRKATARVQPPDAASRARRDAISIRCRSGTSRSKAQQMRQRATHRIPLSGDHPAPDVHVPRLGLAERVAAADRDAQLSVPASGHRRRRTASPTTTGSGVESHHGAHPRAGEAARRQRAARHGVDLERDRQAQGRVEAREAMRRRCDKGFLLNHLIADAHAASGDYAQRRSGHRPGGVVRPARAHSQGELGCCARPQSEPQFAPVDSAPRTSAAALRRGVSRRSARGGST